MTVKRGEIYYADLEPVVGSEQGGERPVVVLQNDVGNKYSPTVIIAPTTSREKKSMPTHVELSGNGLAKNSIALLEQVRTIDKSRLGDYVGEISEKEMKQIEAAIEVSFQMKHKGDRYHEIR